MNQTKESGKMMMREKDLKEVFQHQVGRDKSGVSGALVAAPLYSDPARGDQ